MVNMNAPSIRGTLVEEEIQFNLAELSRACRSDTEQLKQLVDEGVLTPSGDHPKNWIFAGNTLKRARAALRVTRDLELSAAGTALVLNLLDEIDVLRAQLRRTGACVYSTSTVLLISYDELGATAPQRSRL